MGETGGHGAGVLLEQGLVRDESGIYQDGISEMTLLCREDKTMEDFYKIFCVKILDVINTAESALTHAELKYFLKDCKKIIEEKMEEKYFD